MKPLMVIRDPAAYRLLADDTRRKIVFLLRVKAMTVSQIAADLNMSPQAVYHHIRKLLKAQLIEVVKEERVGHFIESYYMSTAEAFTIDIGRMPESTRLFKEQATTILDALKKLGFKLVYSKEDVARLTNLWRELKTCCTSSEFEETLAKLEDVDFLTKQIVGEFAGYLSMSEEDFTQQQDTTKRFRALLCSLVKK